MFPLSSTSEVSRLRIAKHKRSDVLSVLGSRSEVVVAREAVHGGAHWVEAVHTGCSIRAQSLDIRCARVFVSFTTAIVHPRW